MKRTLLVIDGQNDFCDPKGRLYVQNAENDMARLATFITKNGEQLDDIRVTLDSHQRLHVAHPICWIDSQGNHPGPFTLISLADVQGKTPTYQAYNPAWRQKYIDYVQKLADNGRYPLFLWPPHCIIGTWGHSLFPAFAEALEKWADEEFAAVDFVTKGSNIFTENYSVVKADVEDPEDPSTQINTGLIRRLQESDEILIAGEALSHCVANTVRDIAAEFGDEHVKKFVLLTDATSPVGNPPGTTLFSDMADAFIKEMVAKGMRLAKTTDF